jgi:hypothetical protein
MLMNWCYSTHYIRDIHFGKHVCVDLQQLKLRRQQVSNITAHVSLQHPENSYAQMHTR